MATITYTVQTSDMTTVNATHTVTLSDNDLARLLNAFIAEEANRQSDAVAITAM